MQAIRRGAPDRENLRGLPSRSKHIGLMPFQRLGMRQNDLALRLMQRLAFKGHYLEFAAML